MLWRLGLLLLLVEFENEVGAVSEKVVISEAMSLGVGGATSDSGVEVAQVAEEHVDDKDRNLMAGFEREQRQSNKRGSRGAVWKGMLVYIYI